MVAGAAADVGADREGLHTFSARSLGSALRLTVRPPDGADPGASAAAARAAWDAVRSEFDAVDLALSRFRDDSELTALNRLAGSGGTMRVSRRLRTMLAIADRANRMSDGRFDARLLLALERIGEFGASLSPATGTPASPTAAPEPDRTVPSPARDRLVQVPAVPVDSGGIGKGLALRWAAGAASVVLPPLAGLLLEAGGDLVAVGEPPGERWQVGIEDPVAASGPDSQPDAQPVAVVALHTGAVATSSVRVRHWLGPDGGSVHHLLDPRTGQPARTGLLAVTVAHRDPAWAEVWTKTLFLAGRGAIGEEARARDLATWWIDDRGRLGMSPAARQQSAWVDESRLG